jgi:anti-sigma28 factor (negative regulator of flagellin synthesis)
MMRTSTSGTLTKESPMATSKKKSTKKRGAAKATWSDTMKKALESKQRSGGWPDQGKPRDSKVKKLKTT